MWSRRGNEEQEPPIPRQAQCHGEWEECLPLERAAETSGKGRA